MVSLPWRKTVPHWARFRGPPPRSGGQGCAQLGRVARVERLRRFLARSSRPSDAARSRGPRSSQLPEHPRAALRAREPRRDAGSLLLVMRRNGWLLLVTALAAVVLLPVEAHAKGSHLLFAREHYAPGDRAVAHAEVETWKGSGQPEDGPFAVYLVRGTQPLHLGYLPRDAIQVGELAIGRLLATHTTSKTYRVNVAFEVPRVPDGNYAVWVCRAECGANKMFGDLVYGQIVVSRERGTGSTGPPGPAAPAATGPTRGAGFPWLGATLSGLAAVAVLGALHVRRQRREGAGLPT